MSKARLANLALLLGTLFTAVLVVMCCDALSWQ